MCCNKNYLKTLDENLKNNFVNTHKFANNDINKFYFITVNRCIHILHG